MTNQTMTKLDVACELVRAVRRNGRATSDRREQTTRRIRKVIAKATGQTRP